MHYCNYSNSKVSYANKHLERQKYNHSQVKISNYVNQDRSQLKTSMNTLRKSSVKDVKDRSSSTKYKTSKNSPEKPYKFADQDPSSNDILEKNMYINNNNNFNIYNKAKDINLTNLNNNDANLDPLMKRMQKIQNYNNKSSNQNKINMFAHSHLLSTTTNNHSNNYPNYNANINLNINNNLNNNNKHHLHHHHNISSNNKIGLETSLQNNNYLLSNNSNNNSIIHNKVNINGLMMDKNKYNNDDCNNSSNSKYNLFNNSNNKFKKNVNYINDYNNKFGSMKNINNYNQNQNNSNIINTNNSNNSISNNNNNNCFSNSSYMYKGKLNNNNNMNTNTNNSNNNSKILGFYLNNDSSNNFNNLNTNELITGNYNYNNNILYNKNDYLNSNNTNNSNNNTNSNNLNFVYSKNYSNNNNSNNINTNLNSNLDTKPEKPKSFYDEINTGNDQQIQTPNPPNNFSKTSVPSMNNSRKNSNEKKVIYTRHHLHYHKFSSNNNSNKSNINSNFSNNINNNANNNSNNLNNVNTSNSEINSNINTNIKKTNNNNSSKGKSKYSNGNSLNLVRSLDINHYLNNNNGGKKPSNNFSNKTSMSNIYQMNANMCNNKNSKYMFNDISMNNNDSSLPNNNNNNNGQNVNNAHNIRMKKISEMTNVKKYINNKIKKNISTNSINTSSNININTPNNNNNRFASNNNNNKIINNISNNISGINIANNSQQLNYLANANKVVDINNILKSSQIPLTNKNNYLNKSDIKLIENTPLKNPNVSNSTKHSSNSNNLLFNNQANNNKIVNHIKNKNDELVYKDFLEEKIKSKYKNMSKSITTVQSKNNSKHNSINKDYSNSNNNNDFINGKNEKSKKLSSKFTNNYVNNTNTNNNNNVNNKILNYNECIKKNFNVKHNKQFSAMNSPRHDKCKKEFNIIYDFKNKNNSKIKNINSLLNSSNLHPLNANGILNNNNKDNQNILYGNNNNNKNIISVNININNGINNGNNTKNYLDKITNNKNLSGKETNVNSGILNNNLDNLNNNYDNFFEALDETKSIDNLESSNISLDKMLNVTTTSLQSTIRENTYYNKLRDNIAKYIKEYKNENHKYPESNLKFYKYGRLIGKGAFGKVNLALHVCSGRLVAIKSFNKQKLKTKHSKNKIYHEINILKKLRHPFCSQIYDTFETENHILIIMEYICHDLLSFLRKRSKLNEPSAKVIFKQIIEGLKYIHSKKIVHRDIKLENLLIDLTNTVKICDYGVSRKLQPGDIMHEHCGTPAYIAPEIFANKGYEGYSCDIWSAGVTLYYMLAGVQPFKAPNLSELKKVIRIGKYEKIKFASKEANDLIDGMLQIDPKKRLTTTQILNHPWLQGVNLKKRHQLKLFTEAERILLSKYNVDYLNSPKEAMIENFTDSNLKTINDDKLKSGNTKSLILAPYNSNASLGDTNNIIANDNIIKIQNNICKFGGRVKQMNIKYELNNNKDFDNGIIITQKETNNKENNENDNINIDDDSNNSNFGISPNVEYNDEYLINVKKSGLNSPKNAIMCDIHGNDAYGLASNSEPNLNIIKKITNEIGYDKNYLLYCISQNEINYATATYYLFLKDLENQD